MTWNYQIIKFTDKDWNGVPIDTPQYGIFEVYRNENKDWTTPEGLDELEKYCLKPGDLFNVSRISDGRNFWALVDSVPQLIAKISELQTIPELVSDCVSCKQYFNDVQLMAAKIIQLKSKIHNQAARIEELEGHAAETGLTCIDMADKEFRNLEQRIKSRDKKIKTLDAKIKELEATCAKNTHNQCQDPKHLAAVELADSLEYDDPFSLDDSAYERYQQLKTQEDGE